MFRQSRLLDSARGRPTHEQIGGAAPYHGSAHSPLGFGAESIFLIDKRNLLQVRTIALWTAKFHSVTGTNHVKPGSSRLVVLSGLLCLGPRNRVVNP